MWPATERKTHHMDLDLGLSRVVDLETMIWLGAWLLGLKIRSAGFRVKGFGSIMQHCNTEIFMRLASCKLGFTIYKQRNTNTAKIWNSMMIETAIPSSTLHVL